ncbi:MAG: lipopolysaccharide biosynthesis protein [Myxococcota bacterium]
MNFFRNAAGILSTTIATAPVSLVTGILLTRYLDPGDRGLYAIAAAFIALLGSLSLFGWPAATIFRLRRFHADPGEVSAAGSLAVLVSSAIVITLGLVFERSVVDRFFGDGQDLVFRYALATLPFALVASIFRAIARGIDRFRYQNYYQFGLAVAQLAGFGWLFLFAESDLVLVLRTLLVIYLAAAVVLFVAVVRVTGWRPGFEREEMAGSLRYGLKTYAQTLAGQVHERVDIFMLAALLDDPSQAAFYAIAAGLVSRLNLIPDSMSKAVFPQLAGMDARQASEFACRVSRQSFALVLLLAVALAVVVPPLVPIVYGAPYVESVVPFAILLPGVALLTVYRILGRFFMSIDRQSINVVTQVASTLLNIALNFWLIPRHGIAGAAAASLASYTLEATLTTVVFVRITPHGLAEALIFRRTDFEAYRRRWDGLMRRFRTTG